MGKGGKGKGAGVRNRGGGVETSEGVKIHSRNEKGRLDADDPDSWIGWPWLIFVFITSIVPLLVGIYYVVW